MESGCMKREHIFSHKGLVSNFTNDEGKESYSAAEGKWNILKSRHSVGLLEYFYNLYLEIKYVFLT